MTGAVRVEPWLVAVATLALTACGSDGDAGDGSSTTSSESTCRLAISLSGAETFQSDLDDGMSCITAYNLTLGARVAYSPTSGGDVAYVALAFPALEPGQPAASIDLPMTIAHVDRTEFSPTGCVADVTENTFEETTEGGDVYRVVGEGSCDMPGLAGDRSLSVVGFFRFIAGIRWQN